MPTKWKQRETQIKPKGRRMEKQQIRKGREGRTHGSPKEKSKEPDGVAPLCYSFSTVNGQHLPPTSCLLGKVWLRRTGWTADFWSSSSQEVLHFEAFLLFGVFIR